MTDEKYIRIGFFEKFKGENSILISADIHGLLELQKIFDRLSKKSMKFDLSNAKYIDQKFKVGIKMQTTENDCGLKLVDEQFYWKLTKNKWSEFRQLTTAMYRNGTNGHNYLDSESEKNEDLQVVLSLNEYNLDFWNKHRVEK